MAGQSSNKNNIETNKENDKRALGFSRFDYESQHHCCKEIDY